MVAEFQQRFPEIQIEMILADRQVDMIEEAFDVTVRITQPADSSLVARKISPCRFLLAAAKQYLDRFGQPETPEDLRHHNCLTYTYGPRTKSWSFYQDDQVYQVPISGDFHSNNGDLLCSAAEHGNGVVLLPTFILCDAIREGKLIPLLPRYKIRPVGIYAVFPTSRMLSAKVRLWVDFMVEQLGERPHWDKINGIDEQE
jgi:DNA-binding transcriptional LysR family regulator